MAGGGTRRPGLLLAGAALLVVAATTAAYLPALDGAFLLDDLALLTDPLVLRPLDQGAGAWLAAPRPVTLLTFAANHAAVGLDPRGWHLTSLAVHLGAAALAFLLARATLARAGLARPAWPALAAAALFALHPLQSEAVAYLAQRSEALASGLWLGALLLLLARDEAAGPRRHALLAGAALVHLLALGSKPIAATLPAAWLLHAALLPRPEEAGDPWWRRVARRLPAALPLLALSALAAARGVASVAGSRHAGYDLPGLPLGDWLATQLRVVPAYLGLLLWPVGQCGDWMVVPSRSFAEPAVLAGAALLAGLVAVALALGRAGLRGGGDGAAARRVAAFGLLLFLLALAPSSSLVPLRDPMAEHRAYLALLGPALALAAGAAALVRRVAGARAPLAGGALVAAALAILAPLTAARAAAWTTPLAFWSDAARQAGGKGRVQLNLGYALYRAGRPAEALEAFRRAVPLLGDGTVDADLLLGNIVTALLTLGRAGEARAEVERVLAALPGDPATLGLLAQVEYASGRDEAAVAAARRALAADPRQPAALKHLGLAALRGGDAAGALEPLRAAAALDPLDPDLFAALGRAEERAGSAAGACAAWARAAAQGAGGRAGLQAREALVRLGCR